MELAQHTGVPEIENLTGILLLPLINTGLNTLGRSFIVLLLKLIGTAQDCYQWAYAPWVSI